MWFPSGQGDLQEHLKNGGQCISKPASPSHQQQGLQAGHYFSAFSPVNWVLGGGGCQTEQKAPSKLPRCVKWSGISTNLLLKKWKPPNQSICPLQVCPQKLLSNLNSGPLSKTLFSPQVLLPEHFCHILPLMTSMNSQQRCGTAGVFMCSHQGMRSTAEATQTPHCQTEQNCPREHNSDVHPAPNH